MPAEANRENGLVDSACADIASLFHLRHVRCTFGDRGGVEIDRLDIKQGHITAILGRSGSGKTTLLQLLGGMLPPDEAGSFGLWLPAGDGLAQHDLGNRSSSLALWPVVRRKIGFVFQESYLFKAATCRANLECSLAAARQPVRDGQIDRLWEDFELDPEKLDQPAREMSGGMQQRVAVARALIRDPSVIFADEPTASLDRHNGDIVMSLLARWQGAGHGRRAVVLITHDTDLAARWADDIIVLAGGGREGKVGRLSPLSEWPVTNPGSPAMLRAWMDGENLAQPVDAPRQQSQQDEQSAVLPGAADLHEGRRPAGSGPHIRPFAWVGIATALGKPPDGLDPHPQGRSTSQGTLTNKPRSAMMLASAVALVCVAAVAIDAKMARRSDAEPILGISLVEVVPVFVIALLALIALGFRRLSGATLVRSVVLLILALSGLAASAALRTVELSNKAKLSDPELRPYVIRATLKEGLNATRIKGIQEALQDQGIVPASLSSGDRSVYGRMRADASAFIPLPTNAATAPDCRVDQPPRWEFTMQAVSPEEPIQSSLRFASVAVQEQSDDLDRPAERNAAAPTETPLPALTYVAGRGGTLFLTKGRFESIMEQIRPERAVQGATKMDKGNAIGWLCLQLSARFGPEPFKIAAIVSDIPSIDGERFDAVLPIDAGVVAATDGRDTTQGESSRLQFISIWFEPAMMQRGFDHLEQILSREGSQTSRRDCSRMQIRDNGYCRLKQAIDAGAATTALAYGSMVILLCLSVTVTAAFSWQVVEESRREFAVARAFGAGFTQIAGLVTALFAIPAGLSMIVLAATAGVFLRPVLEQVFTAFAIPATQVPSSLLLFASVAIIGALLTTTVILCVARWCTRPSVSIGSQLQEVG